MDADSSYGGSDTAQDSHSAHDPNSSLDTTSHHDHGGGKSSAEDTNSFYHKNEITLPINYDEADFQNQQQQPHYLATANLNINETLENHSNLEELSKKYNSTNRLNAAESPKRPHSGIDNPAFQAEEKVPTNGTLKSTFKNSELNSSVALGLSSPNKHEEPATEAVNLELINLKPMGKDVAGPYENGGNGVSGIPTKKETEVEVGNPYDEYFVPVNEHRKYMSSTRKGRNSVTFAETIATAGVDNAGLSLTTPEHGVLDYPNWLTALENPPRGEKLYLTVDKRNKKKRNRCLCWGVFLSIIAAAVIVGILAAAGVIGPQEAHPVSAREFGSSQPAPDAEIKTGGLFGAGTSSSTTEADSETKRYTPGPPSSTVPSIPPSTETSMIEVPRALEAQLKIDNFQFDPELADKNSPEFKELAEVIENELKNALFTQDMLKYGAADIELKVLEFMPGSVIVKYRIGWVFKDGIHNAKDPIDASALKTKLNNILARNSGYISNYRVAPDSIESEKILDKCQMNQFECEQSCIFDYKIMDFTCACKDGLLLAEDGKTCVEPQSVQEDDFMHVHNYDEDAYPVPAAEPEVVSEHEPEPKPEPEPQPEPEPATEYEPKPVPVTENEPEPVPANESEPKPEPEPVPVTENEPKPEPEPVPVTEHEPKPEPAPVTEHEPKPEPEPIPVTENEPKPEPVPVTENEPKPEPVPITEPELQPVTEYEPKPEPAPVTENETKPQFELEPIPTDEHEASPEPVTQHEHISPETEPIPVIVHVETTLPPAHEHETSYHTIIQPEIEPSAITERPEEHGYVSEHSIISLMEPSTVQPETEPTKEDASQDVTPNLLEVEQLTAKQDQTTHIHTTHENMVQSEVNNSTESLKVEPITEHVVESEREGKLDDSAFVGVLATTEVKTEGLVEKATEPPMTVVVSTMKPEVDMTTILLFANEPTTVAPLPAETPSSDTTSILPSASSTTETLIKPNTENDLDVATIKEQEQWIPIVAEPDLGKTDEIVNSTEGAENEITHHTPAPVIVQDTRNLTETLIGDNMNVTKTENVIDTNITQASDDGNFTITETHHMNITTNLTHEHVATETENSNILDNMSPFLPETENNDTLIHILHSDVNHYPDHVIIHNETGNEEPVTNPPRLDNDEMNTTNPADPTPKDTIPGVLPLDEESTERSNEIGSGGSTTPMMVNVTSPTTEKENEIVRHNEDVSSTDAPVTEENVQATTATAPPVEQATQPPLNSSSSESSNPNLQDFSSSTEDLIAMETTTNRLVKLVNNTNPQAIAVLSEEKLPTTVHAEIIETVTHAVDFVRQNDSSAETENDVAHETVALPEVSTEGLSVVPLPEQETNDTKQEIKRVVDENEYNKLEANDLLGQEKQNVVVTSTTEKESIKENLFTDAYLLSNNEQKPIYDKYDKKNYKKEYYDKKGKLEKFSEGKLYETSTKLNVDVTTLKEVATPQAEIASKCSAGQFQCVNGTSVRDGSYCIDSGHRCDSVSDCSDGSDEENCQEHGCYDNFQCGNSQCLRRHLVCDGIIHCSDGTDEGSCDTWQCTENEFKCSDGGRCIPQAWKCDGRSQCKNATDEHNCRPTQCSSDEFHCTEQDTCIPLSWRCDGKSDCMGDDDEKMCECKESEFKCVMGGGCLDLAAKCDGVAQCPDLSDEWDCFKFSTEENGVQVQLNNSWYKICSNGWTTNHSDLICQQMSYGKSLSTTFANTTNPEESLAQLKQQPNTASILQKLEKTDAACDSIVAVTCQEYSCGSEAHSSTDVRSARIIGGSSATENQWPSVALLHNKKNNTFCTASIVSPIWALASYLCVTGVSGRVSSIRSEDWMLYTGGTEFFVPTDNPNKQVTEVERIVLHPQAKYSQFQYSNDVALIKLSTPLSLEHNTSAICLPHSEIEPRQLCVTAGWGTSKPGESNFQQYLNYLPVPTMDTNECNSTKHYNGQMMGNQICAGYTDAERSPCYNDEGAPLMCFSDTKNTWELQGVLSHHENCGRSRHPSVFTAVSAELKQWIYRTIGRTPS